MANNALERLPTARDIATEIYETAQRGRQLRSLYRVLRKIEQQKADAPEVTALTTGTDAKSITTNTPGGES